MLENACRHNHIRFFYGVAHSQYHSCITYNVESRKAFAGIIEKTECLYVDDDAYWDLISLTDPCLRSGNIFSNRPSSRVHFQKSWHWT